MARTVVFLLLLDVQQNIIFFSLFKVPGRLAVTHFWNVSNKLFLLADLFHQILFLMKIRFFQTGFFKLLSNEA